MGLDVTLVFYVVIGIGVASAIWLGEEDRLAPTRGRWIGLAVPFWPVFVPVLLTRPRASAARGAVNAGEAHDEMARVIAQVDGELQSALASLDGWPEEVLARESLRIGELLALWTAQAERIREMDRLLAGLEAEEVDGGPPAERVQAADVVSRRRQSELARRANIDRLAEVRAQSHAELMGTLAWVRELVSMIHLAKFTGAPASRAEELVSQIAAAVKGVSAVTWQSHAADGGADFPAQTRAAG